MSSQWNTSVAPTPTFCQCCSQLLIEQKGRETGTGWARVPECASLLTLDTSFSVSPSKIINDLKKHLVNIPQLRRSEMQSAPPPAPVLCLRWIQPFLLSPTVPLHFSGAFLSFLAYRSHIILRDSLLPLLPYVLLRRTLCALCFVFVGLKALQRICLKTLHEKAKGGKWVRVSGSDRLEPLGYQETSWDCTLCYWIEHHEGSGS